MEAEVPLVDITHLVGDNTGVPPHVRLRSSMPVETLSRIMNMAFNETQPGAIPNLLNLLEQSLGNAQARLYAGRIIGDSCAAGAKRLARLIESAGPVLTPELVAEARVTLSATLDQLRELGLLEPTAPAGQASQPPTLDAQ